MVASRNGNLTSQVSSHRLATIAAAHNKWHALRHDDRGWHVRSGHRFRRAIELHRDVPRRSAHPCALRNANTNPNADCGSSRQWDGYAAPCSQGALNATIRCGRFLEEENALPAERTENPRPPRTQHRRGNARPGTSAKRQ